jgi:hypothetical protein
MAEAGPYSCTCWALRSKWFLAGMNTVGNVRVCMFMCGLLCVCMRMLCIHVVSCWYEYCGVCACMYVYVRVDMCIDVYVMYTCGFLLI